MEGIIIAVERAIDTGVRRRNPIPDVGIEEGQRARNSPLQLFVGSTDGGYRLMGEGRVQPRLAVGILIDRHLKSQIQLTSVSHFSTND